MSAVMMVQLLKVKVEIDWKQEVRVLLRLLRYWEEVVVPIVAERRRQRERELAFARMAQLLVLQTMTQAERATPVR